MKHQLKRKEGGGGDHCWQRTQSVQGKRRAGFGGENEKKSHSDWSWRKRRQVGEDKGGEISKGGMCQTSAVLTTARITEKIVIC